MTDNDTSHRSTVCQSIVDAFVEHVHIVNQETREIHRYYTVLMVGFVWVIQLLSINGIHKLSLDFIGGSSGTVNLFLLVTILSPISIVACAAFFMMYQRKVKKQSFGEPNWRFMKDNRLFKAYIALLRFNYFIVEPIATGFLVSLVPAGPIKYSLRDQIDSVWIYVLVPPTVIGFILSLVYAFFIESILPNTHILSCSNIVNFLMINFSVKLGILVDSVLPNMAHRGDPKLLVFFLVVIRNAGSFFTIYWNLNRSYYFHVNGRLISTTFHASLMVLSFLHFVSFLWRPLIPDQYMIIPALLIGSVLLKLIINLTKRTRDIEIDPNTCKLNTVLYVAHNCYLSLNRNDESDLKAFSVQIRGQIESYLAKKSSDFELYRLNFTSMGQDPQSMRLDFAMFLFYKLHQREKSHSQKVLLFQGYYLNELGFNIHLIASVLAAIRHQKVNLLTKVHVECLRTMIGHTLSRVYVEQIRLNREEGNSYKSGFGDKRTGKKEYNQADVSPELVHTTLDLHECLTRELLKERMIKLMCGVLQNLVSMYEKVAHKSLESIEVHQHSKQVINASNMIKGYFYSIENSSILDTLKPTSHLLPYALFVDTVLNDYGEMSRSIKMHRKRSQVIFSQQQRHGQLDPIVTFQQQSMVVLAVSALPAHLGAILYSTKNLGDLFQGADLSLRHLSDFFSESFQSVHAELMADFILHHNSEYLGVQRSRFMRTDAKGHFEQINTLVKLGPQLCYADEVIFCCLLSKISNSECSLVVSSKGHISGQNRTLECMFPEIIQFAKQDVGQLSAELKTFLDSEVRYAKRSTIERMKKARQAKSSGWEDPVSFDQNTPFTLGFYRNESRSVEIKVPFTFKKPEGTGIRPKNEITVKVHPIKTLQLNRRILFTDIIIELSSEELLNLNREKESSSQASKQVLRYPISKSSATQLELLAGARENVHSKMRFGATMGQYITEERDSLKLQHRGKSEKPLAMRREECLDFPKKILQIENSLASEINLESTSSSIGSSTNSKSRVFRIINRQKKFFVWKELLATALVQLLIWVLSIYVTSILDQNYNVEMTKAIELRKGVWYFALSNAKVLGSLINNFEYVFENKGLTRKDRYRHLFPRLARDFLKDSSIKFRESEKYSRKLLLHIYSFEASYAERYLQYEGEYTTEIGPSLKQTFTKAYDVNEVYYMAYAALRRWNDKIDMLDLNNTDLTELYEVMGVGILGQIGTKILNTLIDSDVEVYNRLTLQTRTSVIVSIATSLIVANLVIILILMIRAKMIFLYSAFRKLYDSEIESQTAYLVKVLATLRLSLVRVREFEVEFFRNLREQRKMKVNLNEQRRRGHNNGTRKLGNMLFGECFGLVSLVSLSFLIMEAYNLTVFFQHNHIRDQTEEKLNLLANYRRVLSGSASVTSAVSRMFAYVTYSNGLGLQDLNRTAIPGLASIDTSNLEGFFGVVDNFVQTLSKEVDSNKVGGFDIFLKRDPCSFVDVTRHQITLTECHQMAEQTMGKDVITVFRWMRFTLPIVLGFITTLKGDQKYDLMSGRRFTEINAIREIFMVPFTEAFCEQFFESITKFHQYTITQIRVSLTTYLILSIVASIVINLASYRYVLKQIQTSLASFHLLPSESAKHNPQIGEILHSLN